MPPEMGLQVAGFAVHFAAAFDVADVLLRLVGGGLDSGHAVGAFAATASSSDALLDVLRCDGGHHGLLLSVCCLL